MKKLVVPIAVLALLGGRALLGAPPIQQEDAKAKAASWIAKGDSTKALVDGVLAAAVEAGAEKHAVAKDYVTDASRWMTEGDKSLKAAKEAFAAEDYVKAGNVGNMAWQYYVKSGTAAVLANKLVSGGT
jgi:hypothetical protein